MYWQVAQLAEQRTVNPLVVGSIPTLPAMKIEKQLLNIIQEKINQRSLHAEDYRTIAQNKGDLDYCHYWQGYLEALDYTVDIIISLSSDT